LRPSVSNHEVLSQQSLRSAIKMVLLHHLAIRVESDETDLSGALDSLALVQLVAHLEGSLGVRVPMENLGLLDVDSFLSVSTLAELVEANAPSRAMERRHAGSTIEPLAAVASSEDPAEL